MRIRAARGWRLAGVFAITRLGVLAITRLGVLAFRSKTGDCFVR